MKQRSRSEVLEGRVIGLDVSDRRTQVCEIGAESGEVLSEWRVETRPDRLAQAFQERKEIVRIALEAGKHSPWMSRLLEDLDFEVVVANPRKTRLIYENRRKSDRVDAQHLARLARADPELLHPIRHRSREAQVDLAAVRARDALVRSRTQLINHVRGAVKSLGSRIPKVSAQSFARRAMAEIPGELQPALSPLVRTIQDLTDRIRALERELEVRTREQYPECELLQAIKGVGVVTALTYRLVIEDPRRFPRSRTVGAYLGLAPAQKDSGELSPQLRITKSGDALLRRLLIQAAHYILGPFGEDCDLKRYGERIAARGGPKAKRIAVVAVARKLAVLLLRLWAAGEVYDPLRATRRQEAAA
jgi:transposase